MDKKGNTELYAALIERQKERLDNARRRQGEHPTDSKAPSELVQSHLRAFNWMLEKKPARDTFFSDSSAIAPYYPPSITSIDHLEKMQIKNLQLETHHRGFYLMLAASMHPVKIAGVIISLMRDEANAMVMSSHHHEDAEGVSLGGVFIIKEPYFTITSDGDYCVRVDHVTDMIHISAGHERVPLILRPDSATGFLSPPDWRDEGNLAMGKGKYIAAAMAYTSALESNPNADGWTILRMNRALANLRIRSYDRALKDVKLITEYDRPPEKALYRASQAQYYLGRFRHCFETLTKLLREYPGNEAAIREKARAQRRLVEQKHGRYEFRNMYDASKAAPLYLDHATHVGPVKVKKSEGRGRGLFITKNVVAGELLLCEKAFSYSYEEKKAGKSEDSSGIPMLANILTNRVTVGTQVDLMKEIIQKLKWNPCFLRSITALHHGSYIPVREADVDDHPVIDTFLIYHIVSLNTFGCPITSQASHANGQALPPEEVERQHSSSGLWLTASRINHSCFYNTRRSFIGDMQIVRAACDMPRDTEITFMYQAAKSDASESNRSSDSYATQNALENWGFECTCVICTYDKTTAKQTLQNRAALLDELESSFKHFSGVQLPKAETLLAALEKTYSMPAVEVPRLAIWQPYLFMTRQYVGLNNPQKTISTALNLLNALGFVIKGLPVASDDQSPNEQPTVGQSPDSDGTCHVTFQVIKWGLVVDHVIEVFMHIWKACLTVQPLLCEPVERAARTTYLICVGEEDTFWETYGKCDRMEKPISVWQ